MIFLTVQTSGSPTFLPTDKILKNVYGPSTKDYIVD